MKKPNGKLTFASSLFAAGTLIGMSSCGLYGPPEPPAQGVYGPPEYFGIEDDNTASFENISPEVEIPVEEEKEYDPALVFTWTSDDESLSVVQDYNTDTAYIVDGDEKIPVDISMGVYGARVMKCDIDGDGEDEYLISESEGTGSGYSIRGLCIVEKTGDEYKLTRYDGHYFTRIIDERCVFFFDGNTRDFTVSAENENGTYEFSRPIEGEDAVQDIVWRDQIGIYFEDGKVYMSSEVGFFFEGHNWVEYEQSVELYAPITIDADSKITVGDIRARNSF
ncbi:MAG: hypothetical protein J5696_00570 [Lachnospiraceae bacterium]|nr:hypothetical protein [Lachnospiraceae bacterium]